MTLECLKLKVTAGIGSAIRSAVRLAAHREGEYELTDSSSVSIRV
jgi:hypothetical protein